MGLGGGGHPAWLLGVHRIALPASKASYTFHKTWLKTAKDNDKTGPGTAAQPEKTLASTVTRDIRASHPHRLLLKREMNTFSEGKE